MEDRFDADGPSPSAALEEPCFYTVEEAATILRIGRTTAYRLANLWVSSAGTEGLQAIMIGGQLRVPRVVLERLADGPVRLPARTPRPPIGSIAQLHRSAG